MVKMSTLDDGIGISKTSVLANLSSQYMSQIIAYFIK